MYAKQVSTIEPQLTFNGSRDTCLKAVKAMASLQTIPVSESLYNHKS